ncbi:MAG: pilin [Candidatus Shapirobacteria bacterium]
MKSLIHFFKPSIVQAAVDPGGGGSPIIGTIKPPIDGNPYFEEGGIFLLIGNIFKLAGTIGGLFFIIQVILAGYEYITAGGDSKKTEAAWAKIWQSILGIIIIASAFTLAGVIERITGIPILTPNVYGPND